MLYGTIKAKLERDVINAAIAYRRSSTPKENANALQNLLFSTDALIEYEPKKLLAPMSQWIASCDDAEIKHALAEAQRGAVIFPDACESAACFCMNTGDNAKAWAYAIAYVLLKGES